MANKTWKRSNSFIYGEIGERLSGIRESQVYEYSANSLTNWYITEAGNLKAAKKYKCPDHKNAERFVILQKCLVLNPLEWQHPILNILFYSTMNMKQLN